MRTRAYAVLIAPALVAGLTACTQAKSSGTALAVDASDNACRLAVDATTTGDREFKITNSGTSVTEFYLLNSDGMALSEAENLTPGTSRSLHVTIKRPGTYEVNCKPGMVGDGFSSTLTVTGSAITTAADPKLAEAAKTYQTWVAQQSDDLLARTREFAAAVKAKDVAAAQRLYSVARAPWERIEPVAESFGDLDPAVDGREDVVAEGRAFTGFHRLEKDLWVDGLKADSDAIADQLVTDVTTIVAKAKDADLDALKIANGAKELLDEMATAKITGEEDRYSHTDLADFAANWEGSRKAMEVLRPALTDRNAQLVARYEQAATTLETLLATFRRGDGYVAYDQIPKSEIKALSDALTAVGEQVGLVGAALATQ